ncbi:MAG: 2-dehydro-3-deoxygalactonokinase [Thalassovita sp.]
MNPHFALVDWGTSSFRLWIVDQHGEVLAQRRDKRGMSTLTPDQYAPFLEGLLSELAVPKDLPVLVCGMAGAAQGWHPVPYRDVPCDLTSLPQGAVSVPGLARDVRIMPGLAQRTSGSEDVIRGEETILIGALAKLSQFRTICMPGTHSKWVQMRDGHVRGFQTAMTGEVFALLSSQSTLSHYLQSPSQDRSNTEAFDAAVTRALAQPGQLLGSLFSLRARPLLTGDTCVAELPAYLSGLLIGMEIAGMDVKDDGPVLLLSDGVLARNYARALTLADVPYQLGNAEELALAGLFTAAQALWD